MEPSDYSSIANNPQGLAEPTEKVSLHISCQNLANLDTISKSDPQVIVQFHNGGHNDKWKLLGKTEIIENNLNPVFVTSFEIDFYFERNQKVKFEVYDIDVTTKEFIGSYEAPVAKIMGSKGQTLTANLENKGIKKAGQIVIKLEKTSHCNDAIYFTGRGYDLPTKKMLFCLGNDDPFYFVERSRSPDSQDFVRIIQSPVARGTNNPIWRNIMYTARKLCNGEDDNLLKFKFYSWSNSGDHKPYGEFTTSLRQLKSGESEYNLYKINSKVIIPKARFVFEKLVIEERPSFYDFLHSGWQINLTVAVDFTASNGPPLYPDSLHYMNPAGHLNQYEAALMTVGGILMNYDSDQLIPSFGFGGIPQYTQTNQVSHCFHLNGSESPECMGLQGLMEAYKFSLANVKLYGPTFFSPCLQVFNQFVNENLHTALYHILLILTDGEIHDMADTKSLIVAASRLPVSIIIVGVGNEEFKEMIELDSDNKILKDESGNAAIRDIVQFVKYNEVAQQGYQALSEEVLREVPEQVTQFLMKNGIKL